MDPRFSVGAVLFAAASVVFAAVFLALVSVGGRRSTAGRLRNNRPWVGRLHEYGGEPDVRTSLVGPRASVRPDPFEKRRSTPLRRARHW